MIRFARSSYEFSPHHTGGVFASCVFHSHQKCVRSRRHFSFDHVTILRQTTRRARIKRERSGLRDFSRREGFQAGYFRQDLIGGGIIARRARRRGMWIVTVSSLRYVCVRLRHLTLDFLSSGSFRPLLLFFPDDGERFPRRRVSRACPEDGTRGFEAPTRRKDRRRGERRATGSGFLSSRARVRRENARLLVSSEAIANTRNAHVRYLSSLAMCST